MGAKTLLDIRDLVKYYQVGKKPRGRIMKSLFGEKSRGRIIKAVDGISFHIFEGETVALVGESGSGKTTTAQVILGNESRDSGEVLFRGQDLQSLSSKVRRRAQRDIGAVFQNPETSLNPLKTIGWSIAEPLATHPMLGETRKMSADQRRERVSELLRLVRLEPNVCDRFPGAFSGGQKQRIAIARSLALNPSLVVLDEPVTALDVSVQAQILELLMRLQRELGVAFLFIAHDIAVVRDFCDRVVVMNQGSIVEMGSVEDVFSNPRHPYTRALLSAVPVPDPKIEEGRLSIPLRSELASPEGCVFSGRCPLFPLLSDEERKRCENDVPKVSNTDEHESACHFSEKSDRLVI